MLRQHLTRASPWSSRPICLFCAARAQSQTGPIRSFSATGPLSKRARTPAQKAEKAAKVLEAERKSKPLTPAEQAARDKRRAEAEKTLITYHASGGLGEEPEPQGKNQKGADTRAKDVKDGTEKEKSSRKSKKARDTVDHVPKSLKAALLGEEGLENASKKEKKKREEQLNIQILEPEDLNFEPVDIEIPPVPMLSYGLDRVLFNPGVYRLQDPRSRIFNFDPYLEKIMPVNEFDFEALSEYKTSSKDETLLDLTKRLGTKFTGSTSSMSGVLQHFHFLLSNFRDLNHSMLSRGFPEPSKRFSKITFGPDAIFLRYKDGIYAIDADKTFDNPNIMSWLGHSLEKLLTTDRSEFELFRRSSPEKAPTEDNSSRCYHYSKQGNILMRSQLDAHDPRLPGTGVFDLKTRAVVSIRMNHKEYESGAGYQLRYAQGEWESFEREFYDMTRATMLKYSLQVRMGRMDGIFLAYHNIERIFGFQYLSLADMDRVLHGQDSTRLGDQEFKLSIALVDELLSKATTMFPETSIRMHFETRDAKTPFMYVFAEPVTEEQADAIQSKGEAAQKDFARTVVGINKDEEWQNIQDDVDEQVEEDQSGKPGVETSGLAENDLENVEKSSNEVDDNEASSLSTDNESSSSGPLMGWTLTTRSKVNGGYTDRPRSFQEDDDWQLEYHIQEIPEESRWRLYHAVQARRRGLIGHEEEEVDKGLQNYRNLIQRYSNRGRKWRDEQDKLNEEMGVQLYTPMGPGSEAAAPASEGATEEPEKTGF